MLKMITMQISSYAKNNISIIIFIFCCCFAFSFSACTAKKIILKDTEFKYSWEKLETEYFRGKQDDITFVDKNIGWYVNGIGRIFHTKDGGQSWELQLEKKGSFFRTIEFIDKNIGFVGTVGTDYFPNVTDTIPLYGTIDGGKNWNPIEYIGPRVKGLCAIDVVKEQYINYGEIAYRHHIYAVGRVGSPTFIMISHDDGKTWVSESMADHCDMLLDINMLDKNNGFACASLKNDINQSSAVILKTTDGAKTWKKVYQSTRPFESTWKISNPSNDVGYVTIQSYNPDTTISKQRVVKTIDGGETWEEQIITNSHKSRPFGIGFISENIGYVGTMNQGFKTTNGGQKWSPTDLGAACNKIKIYKNTYSDIYGFAIGLDVFKLKVQKE